MRTNYETILFFSDYLEHFAVLVARKQTIIDIELEEVKKEETLTCCRWNWLLHPIISA
jgi:hypothetical protein